jgi:Phage capsid family
VVPDPQRRSTLAIADGIVWGIPKPHSIVVIRQNASVVTDTSVYFTSDGVAVRATLRVGFGFTYPAAVVKVNITP